MINIDKEIAKIMARTVKKVRKRAPYKTGNLANNAIKLEHISRDKYRIYIDIGVAPYAPITNETWGHKFIKQGTGRKGQVRTIWRSWDNPNEDWWFFAVQVARQEIEQGLKLLKQKLEG